MLSSAALFFCLLFQFVNTAKIAIIHNNKNETYLTSTILNGAAGLAIKEADVSYIKTTIDCSILDNLLFEYTLLFETNSLNADNCLIEKLQLKTTNLIIINDNNLMISNLLNTQNRKNKFILNQNFIFNDIISVQLSQHRYYHIVLLISSYSQSKTIEDDLSMYLKCNIYYKCSFELTFILLNQTCIQNSECVANEISVNLNTYTHVSEYNVTTNQLYKDDAILFVISGDLGLSQIMYDKLLKFIYETSSSILVEYNNFDFIIINYDNSFDNDRSNLKPVCEWFSSSFLNYLNNNLNKTTKKSYYEVRKIYYIEKDADQLQNLCSITKLDKSVQFLFQNQNVNKKLIADIFDAFKLVDYLNENKNGVGINELDYYCERQFNEFGSNEKYNVKITNILQYNINNNTCSFMVDKYSSIKSRYDLSIVNSNLNIKNKTDTLTVLAVMDEPFIFLDSRGVYRGYCIDLLDVIAKKLNIKYRVKEASVADYGSFTAYAKDTNGTIAYKWTGMMGELLNGDADLIAGKFILNSIRDEFIDYSMSYYDEGGIAILIKRPKSVNSIFLFIEVFSYEVWICIISIIAGTGFLMHIFERIRINLSKNEDQHYGKDEMQYSLSDSIWITIGCFTLTGGINPPRSISICILIASFWFLSAICISTYQANLSAFLTSSRLQTQITSIKELLEQTNIEYSTIENSPEQILFRKLRNLELEFYNLWKNISISGVVHPTDYIPAKAYAVWDYPLPDVYQRFWANMMSTGLVESLEFGVERVLNSSNILPYVLIVDYPRAKYAESKKCELLTLNTQFARKNYAFGFPTGSHMTEKFSDAILELKQNNVLEGLKSKWWTACELTNQEISSSITLDMVGGSFIMLGVGICLAAIVLFIQSMTLKSLAKKKTTISHVVELSDIHSNGNGNLSNGDIKKPSEMIANGSGVVTSNENGIHHQNSNNTQYNNLSNYLNEDDNHPADEEDYHLIGKKEDKNS